MDSGETHDQQVGDLNHHVGRHPPEAEAQLTASTTRAKVEEWLGGLTIGSTFADSIQMASLEGGPSMEPQILHNSTSPTSTSAADGDSTVRTMAAASEAIIVYSTPSMNDLPSDDRSASKRIREIEEHLVQQLGAQFTDSGLGSPNGQTEDESGE